MIRTGWFRKFVMVIYAVRNFKKRPNHVNWTPYKNKMKVNHRLKVNVNAELILLGPQKLSSITSSVVPLKKSSSI